MWILKRQEQRTPTGNEQKEPNSSWTYNLRVVLICQGLSSSQTTLIIAALTFRNSKIAFRIIIWLYCSSFLLSSVTLKLSLLCFHSLWLNSQWIYSRSKIGDNILRIYIHIYKKINWCVVLSTVKAHNNYSLLHCENP